MAAPAGHHELRYSFHTKTLASRQPRLLWKLPTVPRELLTYWTIFWHSIILAAVNCIIPHFLGAHFSTLCLAPAADRCAVDRGNFPTLCCHPRLNGHVKPPPINQCSAALRAPWVLLHSLKCNICNEPHLPSSFAHALAAYFHIHSVFARDAMCALICMRLLPDSCSVLSCWFCHPLGQTNLARLRILSTSMTA